MHVTKTRQQGFTLIEMVVGITVFAIALTLLTSLLLPQAGKSVDPIMQVRATELAQSLLNEISAKRFDENMTGSIRCNDDLNSDGDLDDSGESACSAILGPEQGEARNSSLSNFDDVDDFNGLVQGFGTTDPIIRNSLGEPIQLGSQNLYQGFVVSVNVFYDGTAGNTQNRKRIEVLVTMPNSEQLRFAMFRSNY